MITSNYCNYFIFLLSLKSFDCYQVSYVPILVIQRRSCSSISFLPRKTKSKTRHSNRSGDTYSDCSSTKNALTPSSLSKSTNDSYINNAEEDFGSVLKDLKEKVNISSSDMKKPLGVEMKNVILRLLESSTNTDETWKLAWSMIRQYASQLSLSSLPDPNLIIPIEAYNSLLTFITRSNGRSATSQLQHAVQILDEILVQSDVHPLPDFSTYTILVEATCAESRAEQAVQILLTMKEDDIQPTLHIYELVIGACVKKNHWRRAIQILDLLIKDRQQGAITVESKDKEIESKVAMLYSSVISSCAKSGEISRALKLFKDMRKLNISSIPINSYNALMSACASSDRYWKDAIHIFDELSTMASKNSTDVPNPDIYTLTIAIRACARGKQLSRALSLLQQTKEKGFPLDVYLYTSAMDACAKAGSWQRALELLDEMILESYGAVKPNSYTYTVAITACSNGGQWERALDLLQQMKQQNIKVSTITYNAVISALAKGSTSKMKKAVKQQMVSASLYNRMESGNSKAHSNADSVQLKERKDGSNKHSAQEFNDSNEKDQLWSKALDLLEQMKREGVKADAITYSSAIVACGSAGRWKEVLKLLKVMQKGGPTTRPNRIAYTNAITACGRSGEYQHALEVFNDMKRDGIKPDRVSYNALISALKVARQPDRIFQLWSEMIATNNTFSSIVLSPDIVTVTDVIAGLERSSEWQDKSDLVFAEAVRRKILLREDSLDSMWDVDLSGMSFPVAHTAVRFVIRRLVKHCSFGTNSRQDLQDMTFITGIGVNNNIQRDDEMVNAGLVPKTLREFVRETLRIEYGIFTTIPKFSAGSVVIKEEMLQRWMSDENEHFLRMKTPT